MGCPNPPCSPKKYKPCCRGRVLFGPKGPLEVLNPNSSATPDAHRYMFWTSLHPKDCHTTDQKYRPGLQFEAMPQTPRAHLFFSKTSQAFVGKRVPSDQIASLEFGFKTSINGFGLGKFLKSIVLTNSAHSEFYAESYALSLTATRPRGIKGYTLSFPSPSAAMRVQRTKGADYHRVQRLAGLRIVPFFKTIQTLGRQEKAMDLSKGQRQGCSRLALFCEHGQIDVVPEAYVHLVETHSRLVSSDRYLNQDVIGCHVALTIVKPIIPLDRGRVGVVGRSLHQRILVKVPLSVDHDLQSRRVLQSRKVVVAVPI